MHRVRSKPGAWWIEQERAGWCLTLMARAKPPANAPYPRATTYPQSDLWLDEVCAPGAPSAQARASGADTHRHQPGSEVPLARLVWQSGQRSLPGGIAKGASSHWSLSQGVSAPTGAHSPAYLWPVWDGSRTR